MWTTSAYDSDEQVMLKLTFLQTMMMIMMIRMTMMIVIIRTHTETVFVCLAVSFACFSSPMEGYG